MKNERIQVVQVISKHCGELSVMFAKPATQTDALHQHTCSHGALSPCE